MVASESKSLSCYILKVKFKHEVNILIIKDQKLHLQQNNQIPPSKHHQAPFSLQLTLLKVMVQYSCRTRMEKVSNFPIDTGMSSNQRNTYNLNICIFTTLYSYRL